MGYFSDQQQEQYERGEEDIMLAEQHQMTIEALKKCVRVLTAEELALICYHCGVQPKDLL